MPSDAHTLTQRPRWSDNDRHLGPFTYSPPSHYHSTGINLTSGGEDGAQCNLRIHVAGHTLILWLPPILRPWRQWVDTSRYEWSSPAGGYWDTHPRRYGFNFHDGSLHVHYGPSTMDSDTDKVLVWFIPWRQWRHHRFSLYDASGEHVWTQFDGKGRGIERFSEQRAAEDACPSVRFRFKDFDGEEITATTRIHEREWLFGEGWFKWLAWFRAPKIRRALDIRFSAEVGHEKGSWKGGTLGHGIYMLPGELHEAAFRRYCTKHLLTFVGAAA